MFTQREISILCAPLHYKSRDTERERERETVEGRKRQSYGEERKGQRTRKIGPEGENSLFIMRASEKGDGNKVARVH